MLDRGPMRFELSLASGPGTSEKGVGVSTEANRVAHDRMHEALVAFRATEGDGGTVLRELILGNVLDINESATLAPDIRTTTTPWPTT